MAKQIENRVGRSVEISNGNGEIIRLAVELVAEDPGGLPGNIASRMEFSADGWQEILAEVLLQRCGFENKGMRNLKFSGGK